MNEANAIPGAAKPNHCRELYKHRSPVWWQINNGTGKIPCKHQSAAFSAQRLVSQQRLCASGHARHVSKECKDLITAGTYAVTTKDSTHGSELLRAAHPNRENPPETSAQSDPPSNLTRQVQQQPGSQAATGHATSAGDAEQPQRVTERFGSESLAFLPVIRIAFHFLFECTHL